MHPFVNVAFQNGTHGLSLRLELGLVRVGSLTLSCVYTNLYHVVCVDVRAPVPPSPPSTEVPVTLPLDFSLMVPGAKVVISYVSTQRNSVTGRGYRTVTIVREGHRGDRVWEDGSE